MGTARIIGTAALAAALLAGCGTYAVGLRLGGARTARATDPDRIQLFAEPDVGRPAQPLAVVVGVSNLFDDAAFPEAMENLRKAAAQYGADAVVGVTPRVDQGYVTLTGVAVLLRPGEGGVR
jgi:hypothetical protein